MSVPADAKAVWRGLDAFARTLEPRLRRAFLKAVQQLRSEVTEQELLKVVETGDPTSLINRLNLDEFKLSLRSSVIDSAGAAAPGIPLPVHFDLFNPYVARALQLSELTLLQGLKTEVQSGIRQALIAGARQGLNPVDVARGLRTVVGLSEKQVQSVANYRQLLTGGAAGQPLREALSRETRDGRWDKTILNAIRDKAALPTDSVDAQVKRFEERLLKQRAETVARTESISALWHGQHLVWQQAIAEGKVQQSALRRFWYVAKDVRVCPYCLEIVALNPDGVAFDQPFQTPDGVTMGPAAHKRCRCVVFIRIQFLPQEE